MADSIEKQILVNLAAILTAGCTWVKKVNAETVFNAFTDLPENEIPCIQIFDNPGATIQHQRTLIQVGWPISVELVLKSTRDGAIDQGILFDRKKDIQDVISNNQKLLVSNVGIDGFQHLRYDSFETDLHTTPNFFAVRLDYTALFIDKYPGCG